MKLTFTMVACLFAAISSVNAACCEMASNPRLCGFSKETVKSGDIARMKGRDLLGSRETELVCCCSAATCPPGGGCA
ncbi:hypothetical protein BDY19DRAFT_956217 [Irpex rosettiformis]|uniref:Uncharacterized protein n=1 Tax=Irpex rosettiformis TaxID=378272 RepID=A0ACB8TYP3_9APHY|nr:hypothetical protein BDY19DRAFT_956217 [Irpex rosettiformis]